jgi:two-component system, OmpR family, alkaline phosphatase synthesis response regulator PhoP
LADKKILIVDDEPHVIRLLSFMLKKDGYDVATAENGEVGVIRAREIKPDLMFLDVMMPKMNGHEVCQTVRADPELSQTRIVMLTASGQEADRERGISLGVDEFITKPFSPRKVSQLVKDILV